MAAGGLAVGVDVGGTKLAAGLVAADGTVVSRARHETPAEDADKIVAAVHRAVAGLMAPHGGGQVPTGVGAAGLIDLDGVVRYAPNLAWVDFPLRARLAAALGMPVVVENDAAAATWGEFRAGAGARTGDSMLMLTIGTGVGGGLVLDGRLVRGVHGFGAEFGHVVVAEGGPECGCGNRGCLEAVASGNAIGRTAREALEAGDVPASSALWELPAVTGKSVTVAAHAGDGAAVEVLARCGFWLGVGIASMVNALDPGLVVVGGGGMQAGRLLLDPARAAYEQRLMGRGHRAAVPVVPALLGDDAGVIGAAMLALEGD